MLSRPNPPPPKPSPSPPQHNTANRQPRSSGDRSNDDRGTGGNVADKTESVVAPKDSSRLSNSDMNRNGDTDIVTSAKELDAEEAVRYVKTIRSLLISLSSSTASLPTSM